MAAPSASISAIARPAARKAPRRVSTSPIGRGAPRRRGAAHALSGARDHHQRARHGVRRRLLRPEWGGAVPAGGSRDPGRQRHRHASTAPQFGLLALSERPGQLLGPGRQEPDAASLAAGVRLCRRGDGRRPRPADGDVEQGVLRDRARRAASCGAIPCSSDAAPAPPTRRSPAWHWPPALGQGPSPRLSHAASTAACWSASPARTCRKSTTASRSTRC